MRQFKDNANRDWTLAVNTSTIVLAWVAKDNSDNVREEHCPDSHRTLV